MAATHAGGLVLGTPQPRPELDEFLLREGYLEATRLYHPVLECWCGGSFTEAPLLSDAFRQYQLCQACGCLVLRFVSTQQGLEELYSARYFREHQAAIGLPTFETRWTNDALDRIPRWIDVVRRYCPAGRILEIGCSHGRFLFEISRCGDRALGLELDAEIAAWGRSQNGQDIRSLRLEDLDETGFDVVFAADVLEHVSDPRGFVACAAEKLGQGGHALFQTVVYDSVPQCPATMARPLYHTILYHRDSLRLLSGQTFRFLETVPSVFGCHFAVFQRA
jgi:hypothetical protein